MSQSWDVIESLLGGTSSMRKAGKTYLPKMEGEDETSYAERLKAATLFPAFSRTVSVMSSKPFSKPLTLGDDVPARLVEWLEYCDRPGKNKHAINLHNFAYNVLYEALAYGLCGVLVDYPKASGVRTLADERGQGLRPYFVHVKHNKILGWVFDDDTGELIQLRLSESKNVPDGQFGTKEVKRVRVLEPGRWALFEERTDTKGNKEFVLIDEGVTTLRVIPFVPFYGIKEHFMEGYSPLIEMAHLNIQHWQDSSDQQKSTHFARVRIAALIGAEDLTTPIRVGADHFMQLPTGASIVVVQGSAEAVKIGRDELNTLEGQMLTMGAELLIQKPDGQRTATESNNDAEANKSDLQRIAGGVEDGIDACLQLMADWVGEPEGGHIKLFDDYGAGSLSDVSAQLIVTMQQGGLLSKPTALREQQRRGVISPDIIPEDELALVDAEGPPTGLM